MPEPEDVRKLLQTHKKPAAGQTLRQFLPNGLLEKILDQTTILDTIGHPSFLIDPHKRENTAEIVSNEGVKVFAILIELRLEHTLASFIENETLDGVLPANEEDLKMILCLNDIREFIKLQWDYLAYNISRGTYQRKLTPERILPYLEQAQIGGGGYSTVYTVLVHPAHQNINRNATNAGVRLVRKEIRHFNAGATTTDESELLFLLGSLKHRNIVELLAAYLQDGIPSLLFEPADMDLNRFLLQQDRIAGYEDDTSIFKAMHGLSSGLRYLHYFEPRPQRVSGTSAISMHGTHQDIKPRNVLVRGTEFILADFGLSRLKPAEEDSKTTWKDATYEYGAPECRDPITLSQKKIGRASDIWSLSCIISELMVYMKRGSNGIEEFRRIRLIEGMYGKTSSFHDGTCLQVPILDDLASIATETDSMAASDLFLMIEKMFAKHPGDRPDAMAVENYLEVVVLKAFLENLLGAFERHYMPANTLAGMNIFRTKLDLERNCLQAWAWAFGLIAIHGSKRSPNSNTPAASPAIYTALESATTSLTTSHLFETSTDDQDFIISALHHCNDTLYGHLSGTERISADGVFKILSTANANTAYLCAVREIDQPAGSRYGELTTIAAMRYMSLLYSRPSGTGKAIPRIEQSLIEKDSLDDDFEERPQTHWYRYGYHDGEKRKILIEWREYGVNWMMDLKGKDFEQSGETMFQRVQELVALLREGKPAQFRALECLGAFHDASRRQFGLVYGFPDNQSSSVRLSYLLKSGRSRARPHMGQKLILAKALIGCVQSFHMSGWLHKDINSYNILFFTSPARENEVEYGKPYIIGFQHSRQDEPNAYTEGPELGHPGRQYQHPNYSSGRSSFQREFDYYSLGLVLLEVGAWESLSKVHTRHSTYTPSQLRDEYMKICNKQILERMGPIYHEVATTCLQSDVQLIGEEDTVALNFQRDVVDKLGRCCF